MDVEGLIGLVGQYGYLALFFCLWLGIIGMPIPDEVIVMTGGFVASLGLLHPIPAFIVTYLGVVSGLTLGYILGRIMGFSVLDHLRKKKKMQRYIEKSQDLINRYGSYSLCISYFFPIVRHVVPYLVGIGKMSFLRYAIFSYTTGFVWTLAFFIVGKLFGKSIQHIGETVYSYGLYLLGILLIIALATLLIKKLFVKSEKVKQTYKM